jgi:hypothetical protein
MEGHSRYYAGALQDSPVVIVDLDQGDKVPFTKLVITVEPWQSDPVVASIKAAAGLT